MKISTLLIIILLTTTVNARCRTSEDYVINITLPSSSPTRINLATFLIGDTSCYQIGTGDNKIYQNVLKECYLDGLSPSNYNIKIVNGTSLWNITGIQNTAALLLETITVCFGSCPSHAGYVEIRLNGTGLAHTLVFQPEKPYSTLISVDNPSEWTKHYLRKWTYRDETTNNLFNFTQNPSTMNVYCDSSSTFTINLTNEVGDGGSTVIQTKERPRYSVNVNTIPPRIRQDSDTQINGNYYLTNNSNTTTEYIFTLQDYTGGNCYTSTLKIRKIINDTVGLVDVQKFSQDNLIKSALINQTNYGFTVECSDLTRNIGSIVLDDTDTARNIIISTPEFTGYNERWGNLSITTNTDYDTSTITCLIQHPTTLAGYYRVYNWSNNNKTLDYTTTSSGTNITFTYTSNNINNTYWIECGTSTFNSGISRLINIRNDSAYFGGFNIPGPNKILGLNREFIFSISAGVLAVILISLGSGVTYTLYAIVSMLFGIFMWYVGWLPEPYGFYITLLFLAIMLHLIRRRKGGEI